MNRLRGPATPRRAGTGDELDGDIGCSVNQIRET
jgi:hypothetical protein